MPKLHELLAVERQLQEQAQKTRTELRSTFEKKRHLFEEKTTRFQPFEEGGQGAVEHQSNLQTTVPQELKWIAGLWSKSLDVSLRVDDANTAAFGDVTLDDGTVLLKRVPTTALLRLEKRAAEIQELIAAIPTLDPAKGFQPDPQRGVGVYQARENVTTRTKKTQRAIVLYEATKEHPAQAQLINDDIPTGHITTTEWSGMVTPAVKADMLERVEELRRAIKQARARANQVDVQEQRAIGKPIFDYVFQPAIARPE